MPIGYSNQEIIASRNTFGKGEVIWIPALSGLAGRIQGYSPLVALLENELRPDLTLVPFRFRERQEGMLLKTLKSDESYVTLVVNKSGVARSIALINNTKMKPLILFADKGGTVTGNDVITISSEETIVLLWK